MREFVQKQDRSLKSHSVDLIGVGKDKHKPSLETETYPILHLQRSIGNQALQGLLRPHHMDADAALVSTQPRHFGHNLSRISVYPPIPKSIHAKLTINKLGDSYE